MRILCSLLPDEPPKTSKQIMFSVISISFMEIIVDWNLLNLSQIFFIIMYIIMLQTLWDGPKCSLSHTHTHTHRHTHTSNTKIKYSNFEMLPTMIKWPVSSEVQTSGHLVHILIIIIIRIIRIFELFQILPISNLFQILPYLQMTIAPLTPSANALMKLTVGCAKTFFS